MNYMAMPPGPELDRVIAEKVLGLETAPSTVPGHYVTITRGAGVRHAIPRYSTTLDGAWELMRWFAERGWGTSAGNYIEGGWWAEFVTPCDVEKMGHGTGGAGGPVMAICLAALDAAKDGVPAEVRRKKSDAPM